MRSFSLYFDGSHVDDDQGICKSRGTVVCIFRRTGSSICLHGCWSVDQLRMREMPIRIGSMLVGCVVLALGMSIVINSNAGTGPNDLIAIILSDKNPGGGIPLGACRM